MAHATAGPLVHAGTVPRAGWLDALRLGGGIASLVAALSIALIVESALTPDVAPRLMAGVLVLGLAAFSGALLSLGRDVSRRWLAFGAGLGFAPATRRPFFDFGTDRPVLYGHAGEHSARMRLLVSPRPAKEREWLELETEVFATHPVELGAVSLAAFEALRAQGIVSVHARIVGDRLVMRAPFQPRGAEALVAALGQMADAVGRPD